MPDYSALIDSKDSPFNSPFRAIPAPILADIEKIERSLALGKAGPALPIRGSQIDPRRYACLSRKLRPNAAAGVFR